MERKIGEIKQVNGEWCQCIEGRCRDCYFSEKRFLCKQFITKGFCTSGIIFKKLEKDGWPYEFDGHLFQSYRTFEAPIFTENNATVRESGNNSKIGIEIKQNKEDMEEKKQCGDTRFRIIARAKEHLFQATNIAEDKKELEVLDSFLLRCWQMGWLKQYEDAEEKKLNLKPFDIQKAREGKPVCTRDGRKARIICYNANRDAPIIALVTTNYGKEIAFDYSLDGLSANSENEDNDLMMLPEKKEGWVNVYRDCDGANITKDDNIYSSKDAAIASAQIIDRDNYVATTIINWEE